MNTRTVQSHVMFLYPFQLQGLSEVQPAGIYRLVTDQEELCGQSYTTYRTVVAFLVLPAMGAKSSDGRQVAIDLSDLDTCVRADRLAASIPCLCGSQ